MAYGMWEKAELSFFALYAISIRYQLLFPAISYKPYAISFALP
jgi:hypothetical protein